MASSVDEKQKKDQPRKGLLSHLYVQVIIAIVLGIFIGHFWHSIGEALMPLGDAFIKLVKMIIGPVIFITIVSGIASVSDLKKVGRIAAKAMVYFLFFSTLALVVGLVAGEIFQPGKGMNINPATLDHSSVAQYVEKAHDTSFFGFMMNIIPSTPTAAFATGDILQVLFFAILFGVALGACGEKGKPVLNFIDSLSAPIFRLVDIIMKVAPLGAFGAIAFTIGKYGISSVASLAFLLLTFYLVCALFVVIILGAVCRYNGFSLYAFLRFMKDELLLIVGTSSSEAALPSLMEKMERAGIKKSVIGLVVPTGFSFNLAGTNIYMTMATLFVAQALNVELSFGQELFLLGVAILTSKGAAGVTGSGFIILAATLQVIPGLPVAGMALILGIDRLMSQSRSLTNFIGNAVACVAVARWEKEVDEEQFSKSLKRVS